MREAIESVLSQTYENWELLLINDGSRKESTDLALWFSEKYPEKIKLFEHPGKKNLGASASRQLGIVNARGEYLAMLDADDVWLSNKLEEQLAILESNPEVGMLYGNTLYWYSWSAETVKGSKDHIPILGVQTGYVIHPPQLLGLYLDGKAAVPCTCSVIMRREVLEKTGGFEDKFRGMYDDQVIYSKIVSAFPVLVSDQCWDLYRQHPQSMCAVAELSNQTQSSRGEFLKWLEAYLIQKEVVDSRTWLALRRQLWHNQEIRIPIHSNLLKKLIRQIKKWLLKFEERLIPFPIRRWIWLGAQNPKRTVP